MPKLNRPGIFNAPTSLAKSGIVVLNDPSAASVVAETFIPLPPMPSLVSK
jgi:hypothetical protein